MKREYIAKFKKTDGIYTVTFPDFKITGRGYPDLELTKEMAEYMLAEIILEYEKNDYDLPDPEYTLARGTAEGAICVTINVDADKYESDSDVDEYVQYYEYETVEELNSRSSYTSEYTQEPVIQTEEDSSGGGCGCVTLIIIVTIILTWFFS